MPSQSSTSGRFARRAVGWALCCLLATGFAIGPDSRAALAAGGTRLEYKVKAGYLFNFAKVVEWPDGALPMPDSPFVIGMLDGGEALPVVRAILEGRVLSGHPVQVRAVSAGSAVRDVHILFVTRGAEASPEEVLAELNGAATLLVGEIEGFARRGASINFVMVDESVKFEANIAAAGRARLKLGSQLLKLAILVEDGAPAGRD